MNVRLHPLLLSEIEKTLLEIFLQGKKSDHIVPILLKSMPKWGSRDRNFVASNIYEIVRNQRLILHCLEISNPSTENISQIVGAWLILKGFSAENETYLSSLPLQQILDRKEKASVAVKYSVLDELSEIAISQIGEDRWIKELEEMNKPADVFLRVNLTKISREKLQKRLANRQIETIEVLLDDEIVLKLAKRANLVNTTEFAEGLFEIQDAGSQLIAKFLNPTSDDFVIDACAGAGGKTLHLADILKGKSKVLALDIEENKLRELKKRLIRSNFKNVQSVLLTKKVLQDYQNRADCLLLDVPCSGLGVLKRNPDAKGMLTAKYFEKLENTQSYILKEYSKMLKPGGKMVYATCSILPSENEKQIEKFLKENTNFEFIKDRQIWPSETGFDGFYMALLKKK